MISDELVAEAMAGPRNRGQAETASSRARPTEGVATARS